MQENVMGKVSRLKARVHGQKCDMDEMQKSLSVSFFCLFILFCPLKVCLMY